MNVEIRTIISNDKKLIAKCRMLLKKAEEEDVDKAIHYAAELLKSYVQDKKLTGQVLNIRTSRLRDSIRVDKVSTANAVEYQIMPSVKYGAIHEFGGTITPKDADYLHFATSDGAWHKVKKVVIPERSYLRTSINEQGNQVIKDVAESLDKSIKRRARGTV